ncbi:MAG: hypothetical protein K2X27_00140 [Candidatus Obscuribacterales bacterium]|nr:hypothetical protein [Candidatus Obscuribacterales bacterium]
MKESETCPKCTGTQIEPMNFQNSVALNFGTYYLGDLVVPTLFVCVDCGYCESWIVNQKDLEDIRKYGQKRKSTNPSP